MQSYVKALKLLECYMGSVDSNVLESHAIEPHGVGSRGMWGWVDNKIKLGIFRGLR